jgi:hypothetical protein
MGGFMLYDGDQKSHILRPEHLESLSGAGKIDFPPITIEEIQDRSKGDGLSKGLVVIQTGWFVLQCIARGVEHLPITELELVTIAFATLNFATYGLWWHKPLNVRQPVRVLKKQPGVRSGEDGSGQCLGKEDGGYEEKKWRMFKLEDVIAVVHKVPAMIMRATLGAICKVPGAIGSLISTIECAIRDVTKRAVDYARSRGWWTIWDGVSVAFRYVIRMPLEAFGRMSFVVEHLETEAKSVPTFYSGNLDGEGYWIAFSGVVIAIIFGAIHCVAWSFQFPSHLEQLSWRMASLIITGLPFFSFLVVWVGGMGIHLLPSWLKPRERVLDKLGVGIMLGCGVLYILSRVALLVIAFVSLRSLPPGVYKAVPWTTYLPHI